MNLRPVATCWMRLTLPRGLCFRVRRGSYSFSNISSSHVYMTATSLKNSLHTLSAAKFFQIQYILFHWESKGMKKYRKEVSRRGGEEVEGETNSVICLGSCQMLPGISPSSSLPDASEDCCKKPPEISFYLFVLTKVAPQIWNDSLFPLLKMYAILRKNSR